MSKTFIVDLPNPHDLESPWIEYGTYDTKEDALKIIQQCLGADNEGKISLISEIQNYDT